MLDLLIGLFFLQHKNIYLIKNLSFSDKYLKHNVKNIHGQLSSKNYSVEWEQRKHFLINTGPPVWCAMSK